MSQAPSQGSPKPSSVGASMRAPSPCVSPRSSVTDGLLTFGSSQHSTEPYETKTESPRPELRPHLAVHFTSEAFDTTCQQRSDKTTFHGSIMGGFHFSTGAVVNQVGTSLIQGNCPDPSSSLIHRVLVTQGAPHEEGQPYVAMFNQRGQWAVATNGSCKSGETPIATAQRESDEETLKVFGACGAIKDVCDLTAGIYFSKSPEKPTEAFMNFAFQRQISTTLPQLREAVSQFNDMAPALTSLFGMFNRAHKTVDKPSRLEIEGLGVQYTDGLIDAILNGHAFSYDVQEFHKEGDQLQIRDIKGKLILSQELAQALKDIADNHLPDFKNMLLGLKGKTFDVGQTIGKYTQFSQMCVVTEASFLDMLEASYGSEFKRSLVEDKTLKERMPKLDKFTLDVLNTETGENTPTEIKLFVPGLRPAATVFFHQ